MSYSMFLWCINIAAIGTLAYLSYKCLFKEIQPLIFSSALLLKLAAGITLGLVFMNFYKSGDTILYFNRAATMAALPFREMILNVLSVSNYEVDDHPRVLFFTKILTPFVFISGSSYWITSLYLSFLSFFASCYLVINLTKKYPEWKQVATICFLFLPTVIFWTSGILKDTLSYASLLFCIGAFFKIKRELRITVYEALLMLASLFVLYKLKHYLLISLLLFFGFYGFLSLIKNTSIAKRLAAVGLLAGVLVLTQWIHPYLQFDRLAKTIYENNRTIASHTSAENTIGLTLQDAYVSTILSEVPNAIQIGLFRPSISDQTILFGWFHRLENTLLAILTSLSLLILLKEKPKIDLPLTLASTLTILILATMLALSTPNFGTLVRYKSAFLPFLFLMAGLLPYRYLILQKQ
ncbi:MAG: hypothetical protein AAF616_03530 [Bacteroidota bacterium]